MQPRGEANRHRACCLLQVRPAGSSLALPLGSTTRAHHFFGLAEFRVPLSRRCDHFSHHHLFRALRATDRFILAAHRSGYSLHVHGVRSLTVSPFEPDTPAPITPFILTLILTTSARFSTHPAALLLSGHTSRSPLRWSWLELAAALLARQSHGWRGGGSAQRPRSPIPRLNGACSGLVRRVVA